MEGNYMEIPFLEDGILHFDEQQIDLGWCTIDEAIELLGEPEKVIQIVGSNLLVLEFKHLYGQLKLYFEVYVDPDEIIIFHDQDREYFIEDLPSKPPILVESHFVFDMEVTVRELQDRYGPAQFFSQGHYEFAVFGLGVIARLIDRQTVDSLWFLCEDAVLQNQISSLYLAIKTTLFSLS